MTQIIKAIFKNGVFEPQESIELPNNQEVDIVVSTMNPRNNDWKSLIQQIDTFRENLLRKAGHFDSTSILRQDRNR